MASKPTIQYAVHNGTVGEDEAITEANGLKVHATPLVTMRALNNGDFTFKKADAKQAE